MSSLALPASLFGCRNGLLSLVAFLVSRASLLPGSSACCLAFFAGILSTDRCRALMVAFWCFLGLLSAWPLPHVLLYTAMMAVLYLLTRSFGSGTWPWSQPPFLALTVTVLGRGLLSLASGFQPPRLLQVGLEGVLVLVLSMIFVYSLPVFTRRGSLRGLDNEESICVVILGAIVLLGFSGLKFGFLSLQQVFGKYLIMVLSLVGGAGMGAALGTAYGAVATLMGTLPATALGAYAFAGLLSGAFRRAGKAGVGMSFMIGDLALALYLFHTTSPGLALGESLLALTLLLITPSRYLTEVARLVPGTLENRRLQEKYDQRVRQVAVARLLEVSQVFRELASTLEEITATEQSREEERLNQLFREICHQVCESCNLYQHCWEEDFYKTYRLIFDLLGLAEIRGRLAREEIPPEVRRRCVRLQELVSGINHLFDLQRLNLYWQRRLGEKGSMVSNQLLGVAEIVADLAGEMEVEVDYREELTSSLQQQLSSANLDILHVHALCTPGAQLEVNISKTGCPGNAECSRVVRPLVEKVCGRRLRLEQRQCALRNGGGQCVLRLVPARLFSVVTGAARRAKNGGSVSGDNYSVDELSDGRVALILSDGMGVGPRAAEESATTIVLLERLLNAGFNEELSLQTVNNILLLRYGEENFATVDLVLIDLYTGEAKFFKVGSYCSFIKRGRHVSVIQNPSLPVGIVRDIRFQPVKRRLRDGDMIVMVTDGVVEKGQDDTRSSWLLELVKQAQTGEPEEMARQILARAARQPGPRGDDMAVLVARVERED